MRWQVKLEFLTPIRESGHDFDNAPLWQIATMTVYYTSNAGG
ncbi:hypothetical protein ABH897_002078 [Paenibacillus sp. RC73]